LIIDQTSGIVIKRRAFNIIYSNVRELYICPSQLVPQSSTLAPIAPQPYTHDSLVPAPSYNAKTYLWTLLNLRECRLTGLSYFYLSPRPKIVYLVAMLDTISGDDIFMCTNVVPNITDICNHLSPLLVQIPCTMHMFG